MQLLGRKVSQPKTDFSKGKCSNNICCLTYHVDPDGGPPRLPAGGVVRDAGHPSPQVGPPQRPQLQVVLGRALRVAEGLVQQGAL